MADVTDPPTPSNLVPAGSTTSSSLTVYADVYPTASSPAFVSGPTTSVAFTAGSTGSYTGYTTGLPTDTISDTPAGGVTEHGVSWPAGLPSGVGLVASDNSSFGISGAPNVAAGGCYTITVDAANGNSPDANQTLVLDVHQAPAVTSASSTSMATGSPGAFTFTTSGFPRPSLSITGVSCTPHSAVPSSLPADLSFADNGDGTATLSSLGANLADADVGTYSVWVRATSSSGSVTRSFSLTIGGKPVFTSSAEAGFFPSPSSGGFTVTTEGYPTASLSCSIVYGGSPTDCTTGLGYSLIDPNFGTTPPEGLYFADNGDGTASLGGVPANPGEYTVTVTATNAVGSTQQTLDLFVSNTGGTSITFADGGAVTSSAPPSGSVPASANAVFTVGTAGTATICSNDPTDTLHLQSEVAHPYSLSAAPGADLLRITVKDTGDHSQALSRLGRVPGSSPRARTGRSPPGAPAAARCCWPAGWASPRCGPCSPRCRDRSRWSTARAASRTSCSGTSWTPSPPPAGPRCTTWSGRGPRSAAIRCQPGC